MIRRHLNELFARDESCIPCEIADCLSCPQDKPICTISVRTCDTCPIVTCKARTSSANSSNDGPSTGAIVGATIGTLAAVGLFVFVVWHVYGKKRRSRASLVGSAGEKENDFGMLRSARVRYVLGMRGSGPLANTVLRHPRTPLGLLLRRSERGLPTLFRLLIFLE